MGVRIIKNSFTGGEISPRLEGRTDLKQYNNSVAELENFFPHSYGGIAKAPGLYFVCETKDSTKTSILMPFQRKIGQAYIIEVGDYYMRFVRDGQLIRLATDVNDYDAATTYSVGSLVYYDGVNYYSKVGSNLGNQPDISPTQWYALTDDIYEIPTPWSEAEVAELGYCQSVDVMWITHENHPPVRLSRYNETFWTITDEVFIDGPFMPINGTTTQMSCSASSGSVTVTADATNGINDGAGFLSTDIGRQIRLFNDVPDPDEWAWLTITAVTDTTHVTATVESGTAPTVATPFWKLGAFSDTTGYPRQVMFFEQRLVYAGTTSEPQGVWLSQTDAYSLFTVSDPVVDSDACQFVLVADQSNDIAWIMASRELAIGTERGEWTLSGAEGKVISPTSVNAKRYTTSGGAEIRPHHVGGAILFVDRTKRALLEMAYVFEDDGYNSPDLLLLADHITRSRQIVDTAWQGSPDSKLYCVMDDGSMAVLTYKRDQQVTGWARRTTTGLFESAATVSSSFRDVPYFIVNRTINGATKRYIEWMKADFGDAVEDTPVNILATLPIAIPETWVMTQNGDTPRQQSLWGFEYNWVGDDFDPASPGSWTSEDLTYKGNVVNLSNCDKYGMCGMIGNDIYVFWIDKFPTPDVAYMKVKNTFTDTLTSKLIDIDTSVDGQIYAMGVHQKSKTDLTPEMFLILLDPISSHYIVRKGSFNAVSDKWELDPTYSFDLQDDSPPILDTASMQPNYYRGSATIAANLNEIGIPLYGEGQIGVTPLSAGLMYLNRETLAFVGYTDTLGTGMKTPSTGFGPSLRADMSDYYNVIVYDNLRYTYPNPGDSIKIEVRDPVTHARTMQRSYDITDLTEVSDDVDSVYIVLDVKLIGNKVIVAMIGRKSPTTERGTYFMRFEIGSSIVHTGTYRFSSKDYLWALNTGQPLYTVMADRIINYK